jgi:hypothetical protein
VADLILEPQLLCQIFLVWKKDVMENDVSTAEEWYYNVQMEYNCSKLIHHRRPQKPKRSNFQTVHAWAQILATQSTEDLFF